MDVPAVANTLGTVGAICWSIQLVPQIVINYRRHHAIGLQPDMMMLWAWAGIPLGAYNIVKNFNVALQVQPQILTVLSLVTWIQCYHYQKKWLIAQSLIVVVPMASLMAGVEVALIFALRIALDRKVHWPLTLMAVLSAALLSAGVLRHYWDIWVHRTVRGISFLFVSIDAMGDLTSLISLIFQAELDVLGLVIYGSELVLWMGVLACGGYFNFLPWLRKNRGGSDPDAGRQADQVASARASGNDIPLERAGADGITLHDLPSSTSVFRTPGGELALARSRTGGSRGEATA